MNFVQRILERVLLLTLLCAALATSVFAQCGGQITISDDTLVWPGSYIGSITSQSLSIVNTGELSLCMEQVSSTASVWLPIPPPPLIAPGDAATIQIDFLPNLDRWHYGTIEIHSSDLLNPIQSIVVAAQGCQPVLAPPPLQLHPTGSSSVQYYSMPWDENSASTEYAIYIRQFGESLGYVQQDGDIQPDAQWLTADVWGIYGSGMISGLDELSSYEVQLLARDCTGAIAEGVWNLFSTSQEIEVAPLTDVTARYNSDSASIELRWNPTVRDINNNPLPHDGYAILQGNNSDSINSLQAAPESNYYSQSNLASPKSFYVVAPNTNRTFQGTMPLFTWPPQGARLYGLNTVSVKDLLNAAEWSTASLTVDSMGFPIELLWPEFDPENAGGIELVLDFDDYGIGFHTLTVSVTDEAGFFSSMSIQVEVVQRPRADFIASFDPLQNIFFLSATNYQTPPGLIRDTWWPILHVDERYGPAMQFKASEGDSVFVVQPIPIMDLKYLNEEDPWPQPSDPTIGVIIDPNAPGQFQVAGVATPITPCCIGVTLDMEPQVGVNTGPYTDCKIVGCDMVVDAGVRFQIVTNWEWREGVYNQGFTMDARGTYVKEIGTVAGDDDIFTAVAAKAEDTTHVRGANPGNPPIHDLPYAGGVNERANSESDTKVTKHKAKPPTKPNPYGTTKYNGYGAHMKDKAPISSQQNLHSGCNANGKPNAIRTTGDVFISYASYDPCPAVTTCERTWDIHWDVVFWYSAEAPPGCRERREVGPSIAPED